VKPVYRKIKLKKKKKNVLCFERKVLRRFFGHVYESDGDEDNEELSQLLDGLDISKLY
jgi:hypothetical protein